MQKLLFALNADVFLCFFNFIGGSKVIFTDEHAKSIICVFSCDLCLNS